MLVPECGWEGKGLCPVTQAAPLGVLRIILGLLKDKPRAWGRERISLPYFTFVFLLSPCFLTDS